MTTPAALHVRLLGNPHVDWDGEAAFRFRSPRKTLSLLAFLLLHRDGRIDRHHIAFTLWPDAAEETALANLRRNVYLLTRNLPGGRDRAWIDVEASHLGWGRSERTRCDVWEFEAAAADVERAAEAASLYRGDLFQGADDDWIVDARERLRTTFAAVLRACVERERSRGRFTSAVAYAQRLFDLDPWREDALRLLIGARNDAGDRAGALAELDRFVARLETELHVAPMDETLALRARIERDEPVAREAFVGALHEPATHAVLPFVGRRVELAQLEDAWARSAQGAAVVFISGTAGIGKSRLIDEAARRIAAEGGRVVRATTAGRERVAYEPLLDALRDAQPLLAGAKLDTRARYALARLIPGIGFDAAQQSWSEDVLERDVDFVHDAFAQAFSVLARRPLLLILEDLQHAGASTLDALARIAVRCASLPMVIVATYRTEDVSRSHPLRRVRRELEAQQRALEIVVGPLSEDDALELARDSGERDLLRALHARSEGHPLLLGELIREQREGPVSSDSSRSDNGIAAFIAQRLDALEASTRSVAELAAIAGDAFEIETLRDAAGWPDDVVRSALDELVDRAIVHEAGRGRRYAFAFTHGLVRDALYGAQPEAVRKRRHRRIAVVLEERADRLADATTIAQHFERGDDRSEALRWYLLAAGTALEVGASHDAIAIAQHSLELGATDAATSVLAIIARAAYRLGRYDDAEQTASEARARALERGDATSLISALVVLADVAADRGDDERTAMLLAECEAAARSADDRTLVARVALHAARAATLRQDHRVAYEHAGFANRLFHDAAARDGEAQAASLLGYLAARLGASDEARAHFAFAHERYDADANAFGAAGVAVNEAHFHMRAGRVDDALSAIRIALHKYESIDDARGAAVARSNLAFYLVRSGDAESARATARAAVANALELGHVPLATNALGNLGAAETELGELDAALATFERAARLRAQLQRPIDEIGDRLEIIATLLRRGDVDRAGALAESVAATETGAAELSWPFYRDWIVAWSRRSRGEAPAPYLERAAAGIRALRDGLTSGAARRRFLVCPIVAAIVRASESDRWPATEDDSRTLATSR